MEIIVVVFHLRLILFNLKNNYGVNIYWQLNWQWPPVNLTPKLFKKMIMEKFIDKPSCNMTNNNCFFKFFLLTYNSILQSFSIQLFIQTSKIDESFKNCKLIKCTEYQRNVSVLFVPILYDV